MAAGRAPTARATKRTAGGGADGATSRGLRRQGEATRTNPRLIAGPFGPAIRRFLDATRRAEAEIAALRAGLEHGPKQ